MKQLLTIIFLVLFASSNLCSFSGKGSGTTDDPYQITNVEELQEMNNWLDAHYILMNDIDATKTKDWNSGKGFKPIGKWDYKNLSLCFCGSLDGKYHAVHNLFINSKGEDHVGLFACIGNGANISNLSIVNAEIKSIPDSGPTVEKSAGILVGLIKAEDEGKEVMVNNCSTSGTVSGTNSVGGFCGISESYYKGYKGFYARIYNKVTIIDCSSSASVNGDSFIGGFCGTNESRIINCSSSGTIAGMSWVGGFCGFFGFDAVMQAQIINCYSSGSATGHYSVGGFCGYAGGFSEIIKCSSGGDAIGLNDSSSHIGGFCGDVENCTIRFCSSTGSATGGASVGGFCGDIYSGGTLISNCFSRSSAVGKNNVGGFVGFYKSKFGKIENCFSTGVVSSDSVAGGFCGTQSGDSNNVILDCFWDIENSNISSSMGGKGLNSSQMKDQNSFTTYNFEKFWAIDSSVNDGYPFLTDFESPLEFSGNGEGTETNPYQIRTLDHLREIKNNLDAHYVLMNDIDASETVNNIGFNPIGRYVPEDPTAGFTGSLNGQNYSIQSLKVTGGSAGFFGCISDGAYIHNMITEDIRVGADNYMGAFVGRTYAYQTDAIVRIENCWVSGNLSGASEYIGGFCGENLAVNGRVIINNCHIRAYMSDYLTGNLEKNYMGGFCAKNTAKNETGSIEIMNCTANSEIVGRDYIGGFCGKNLGQYEHGKVVISKCSSHGSVNGYWRVGGFCGRSVGNSTIINCYSRGSVEGFSPSGFCGTIDTHTDTEHTSIINCYSTGSIVYDDEYSPAGFAYKQDGPGTEE
ncbi:MAG: hypothetical protein KAH48_07770, partial [Chlorobi bacterium]|nr:hypothetical protein [Chlorobiota bacterium]